LKEHPNIIHSGPTENSKDEIVGYKCLHWAVNPLDLKKNSYQEIWAENRHSRIKLLTMSYLHLFRILLNT